MEEKDEEIDLSQIFNLFLSNIYIIIAFILIFALIGVFYIKVIKVPEYTASTTLILVSNSSSDDASTSSAAMATDLTVNSRLVSTYSELIKSKTVLRKVEENLGMDPSYEEKLRKNINVTSESNTELIKITVTDVNPEVAYNVANEITKVFSTEVEEIYNINNVHIVDNAEIPTVPSNNNNKKQFLIFVFLGIVASIFFIIIKNALDTTVKSEEEVEELCNSHVLASIPVYSNKLMKGGKK